MSSMSGYDKEIATKSVAFKLGTLWTNVRKLVVAKRARIAEVALGHTASKIIDSVIDYGVYIPVINFYGTLIGGTIMMFFLAGFALLELKFYDWSGRDWLGFEALKKLKNSNEKVGLSLRMLVWALRKGDVAAFFALSIRYGPFSTTVYLRGNKKLTKKDWKIFCLSTIVSNWWWVISVTAAIKVVKSFF